MQLGICGRIPPSAPSSRRHPPRQKRAALRHLVEARRAWVALLRGELEVSAHGTDGSDGSDGGDWVAQCRHGSSATVVLEMLAEDLHDAVGGLSHLVRVVPPFALNRGGREERRSMHLRTGRTPGWPRNTTPAQHGRVTTCPGPYLGPTNVKASLRLRVCLLGCGSGEADTCF